MKISIEIVYTEYGLETDKFVHFEVDGQMVKITVDDDYRTDGHIFSVNRKELVSVLAGIKPPRED